MIWLWIALGGALGALMRYGVSRVTHSVLGTSFPYGTLTVNVLGSFVIGALTIILLDRIQGGVGLRAFLIIGFLGAFTTFSSFSIETLNLVETGAVYAALANIILNVAVCLVAVTLGVWLARAI